MRNLTDDEKAERWRLYYAGFTDVQIAAGLGIDKTTIQKWRTANNLPAHQPRRTLDAAQVAERQQMMDAGLSDTEMARRLGVAQSSISKWRRRQGRDPVHAGQSLTPQQRAARLFLYNLGYSDTQIAREQRIGLSTTTRWRERLSLPKHGAIGNKAGYAKRATAARDRPEQMLRKIRRAIGAHLARDVADDAIADLYMAVVDGTISIDEIEANAKRYGNRVLGDYASKFGPRSLDEELGEAGDGFRMIDLIQDERSTSWLEEMGATVW